MSGLIFGVSNVAIILIIIFSIIIVGIVFAILYIFVISRKRYKKQAKDIFKKFSYLDALLVGQCSQYIHRLEIISRTNLLYVDKYEIFSKRFKEVFDNDDRFAQSMMRQLNSLIAARQYKNIKQAINDSKKAVAAFESAVNSLDRDLYEVIKLEEEARQHVLQLKEGYRRVKQTYYTNSSELESVASSFTRIFDKLDATFAKIEDYIESAEYEEANSLLPTISDVIEALTNSLEALPNLCSLIHNVIPEKLRELNEYYKTIEKQGVPLFHLGYKQKEDNWRKTLAALNKKIQNLQTVGIEAECGNIQREIQEFYKDLKNEIEDQSDFDAKCDEVYKNVMELEKNFLRICSLIPEVESIYLLDDDHKGCIDNLKQSVNQLSESRRVLDGFIHSGTKQPYSVLKAKLEELNKDYDKASSGVKDLKAYIDSLRDTAEEAYKMVFTYYYHLKQIEAYIREINVEVINEKYQKDIDEIYGLVDDLNDQLQQKPIDIARIKESIEELKNIANPLFDDVEDKYHNCQLAESAIVYANRDRNHQNDVNQQLNQLEAMFYDGEFETVYHDASQIYHRNHIENADGKATK